MQPRKVCHILRYSRVVLLFLVLAVVSTPADQPDSSKTRQQEIHIKRLVYVGVGAAGVNWAGSRYLDRDWWQGKKFLSVLFTIGLVIRISIWITVVILCGGSFLHKSRATFIAG